MSRYRLLPTPDQEAVLRSHCAHARYVWNLAIEQHAHWRPGRKGAPGSGWVRFRWSRPVPADVKSYRVRMDRAGRWHVAFAAIPEPVPVPGNGQAVGIDRGVVVSAALSTGEMLHCPSLTEREILRSGWGLLVRRLQDKAPGRAEKIKPAFTSQRCSGCGHMDAKSRESQARFACTACG